MKHLLGLILVVFVLFKAESQESFTNYFKDGSVSEKGQLLDGKRIGEYVSYHKNGEAKVIANYIDGFIVQKKEYSENGNIIASIYMLDGSDRLQVYKYDEEGNISKKGFLTSKGLKTGEWLIYNEKNEIYKTLIYEDDELISSH
ncbi:toxin-antitoxin system YwqK family antitoxin [uncultured Winogradskyella sp.]|uniref:toxin-antitoxin system YwqK family antitoxin n=1 Tax=uncultured Winogradskyella sp. TaxID=395353 RepID=UPI002628DCB6|nr:hypothetical protein [uncultured Winogradskyella sp.]